MQPGGVRDELRPRPGRRTGRAAREGGRRRIRCRRACSEQRASRLSGHGVTGRGAAVPCRCTHPSRRVVKHTLEALAVGDGDDLDDVAGARRSRGRAASRTHVSHPASSVRWRPPSLKEIGPRTTPRSSAPLGGSLARPRKPPSWRCGHAAEASQSCARSRRRTRRRARQHSRAGLHTHARSKHRRAWRPRLPRPPHGGHASRAPTLRSRRGWCRRAAPRRRPAERPPTRAPPNQQQQPYPPVWRRPPAPSPRSRSPSGSS